MERLSSRRGTRLAALALASLLLGGLALLEVRACPLFWATGVPCPGCGMVRGCLAVLTGQWQAAWALHPLAFVAVPVLFVEGLWLARPGLPAWRYPRWAFALAAAALVGLWTVRLAQGTHPDGIQWETGALGRTLGYVAGP